MQQIYEQKKKQIENGRNVWLGLAEQYLHIEKEYCFIFPDVQSKCAEYVFRCLPEFIKQKDVKKYFLIGYDERTFEKADSLPGAEAVKIILSRQQIEDLIAYYMFEEFTKKIVIVSLDCPNGRNGSWLENVKSITLEDIVSLGLLNL